MWHVLFRKVADLLVGRISCSISLSNHSASSPLASRATVSYTCLLKNISDCSQVSEAMSVLEEGSGPPPSKKACIGKHDEKDGVSIMVGEEVLVCKGDKIKAEPVTEVPQEVGVVTRRPRKRRKYAVLLSYNGKGYMGMQRNPDVATIEDDLLAAMCKAEAFPADMVNDMGKLKFQRSARTDKGVSAARQVVSLKIRVVVAKRVTKSFDSRHACNARMYEYLLPTYALAPYHLTTPNYRVSDETVCRLDQLLSRYEGTHNYHNFTSGKKFKDMSSKRFIMSFTSGSKFISGDASDPNVKPMEFIPVRVKGQSFVLHQIRKMIGFVVAIIRGYVAESSFEMSFKQDKMDIPKAPSLGLLLEDVYFDHYNARFANSGERERLEWDEFEEEVSRFKSQHIYRSILETELREKPMMQWLHTLQLHNFYSTAQRLREAEGAASASKSDITPALADIVQPAVTCSTTHGQVDPADSVVDRCNTRDSLDDPANTGDSLTDPANTGDSMDDPANTGDSLTDPANTGDSLADPANTIDSQVDPSDSGDSLVDAVITDDSLTNVGHA